MIRTSKPGLGENVKNISKDENIIIKKVKAKATEMFPCWTSMGTGTQISSTNVNARWAWWSTVTPGHRRQRRDSWDKLDS